MDQRWVLATKDTVPGGEISYQSQFVKDYQLIQNLYFSGICQSHFKSYICTTSACLVKKNHVTEVAKLCEKASWFVG
jgi:hypothetical protein